MALRRAKWTHEYNTKVNHRKVFGQFFGTPKILPPLTKLLPEPEKSTGGHTIASDALTNGPIWPDVFTIRAEFGIFLHRVSILCQLRDSVTRALLISIIEGQFPLALPGDDESNMQLAL